MIVLQLGSLFFVADVSSFILLITLSTLSYLISFVPSWYTMTSQLFVLDKATLASSMVNAVVFWESTL